MTPFSPLLIIIIMRAVIRTKRISKAEKMGNKVLKVEANFISSRTNFIYHPTKDLALIPASINLLKCFSKNVLIAVEMTWART